MFNDFFKTVKEYTAFVPLGLLFVIVVSCCLFGLYNNRGGTSEAGKQLEQARTDQSQLTKNLEQHAEKARELREEISGIRNQAVQLGREQQEAGAIIRDCKQILAGVRAREQEK